MLRSLVGSEMCIRDRCDCTEKALLFRGQKQRVAIARALIREPSILMLDEATSALDVEIEIQIQRALDHVMLGRTMLVAAHRLSTIAQCDTILVMEQGQLAERGTHTELIAKGGRYASLLSQSDQGLADGEDEDVVRVVEWLRQNFCSSGKTTQQVTQIVQLALEKFGHDQLAEIQETEREAGAQGEAIDVHSSNSSDSDSVGSTSESD
eukprot:TRINITY_DN11562_c0_g1_i1.p1 TRINITY_DN11562_c0_g1~~TRINITY_DN11562_c0_g1_i1.p1  ORF type:complete len:209 (+),score=44.01 TRINITY_DN11562_c0_g1_i1:74-700(+)